MLLFLIPIAGMAVCLDFAGSAQPVSFHLRIAFLRTVVLLGAGLALISEGLSLFHALGRWEVAAAWGLVILIAVWFGLRRGYYKTALAHIAQALRQVTRFELFLAAGMALILALLLLIVYKSPTNNLDSLEYHMPRVLHWAEDQSLAHYPTQYEHQLYNPIWAEEAILHIRLLWGDDTWAELVQWFAMIACILGVSLLAGLLGARRGGQVAAALFAASIPMGILQATSTQNDYAAALWLVTMLSFTVIVSQRGNKFQDLLFLSGALGLGLLTKPTFYPFAAPVLVWLSWRLVKQSGFMGLVRAGLVVAAISFMLNLGYWTRNLITFGTPFGQKEVVLSTVANTYSPGYVAAAVTRNLAMNFVTPSTSFNNRMHAALVQLFGRYDPNLAGFHFTWGWNHEDRAGSPLHLLLVPVSILLLFIFKERLRSPWLWGYVIVSLLLFVMVSTLIKIDEAGIRYQLPFFVSWAPVFGVALETWGLHWIGDPHPVGGTRLSKLPRSGERLNLTHGVMIALLVLLVPWTLYNRTRSLVAFQDTGDPFTIPCRWGLGCGIRSVLVEPPSTILFTNFTPYRDSYLQMAQVIKGSGCKAVGLDIDSHDPEYLEWWVLDAPQSGARIETIHTYLELERYVDPAFHPCAIICTTCSLKKTVYHGLPFKAAFYGTVLYMGPDYQNLP